MGQHFHKTGKEKKKSRKKEKGHTFLNNSNKVIKWFQINDQNTSKILTLSWLDPKGIHILNKRSELERQVLLMALLMEEVKMMVSPLLECFEQ